jgi:diguanylate cyclase (GGDEF)-like protein
MMPKTPQAKVLLVTRRSDLAAMGESLGAEGYEATIATEAGEALRLIAPHSFQAILVDLDLSGKQDLNLLEAAVGSAATPAVIACNFTGTFTVDALLAALRKALDKRLRMQELVSLRKVVEVFSSLQSLESTYEQLRQSIAGLFQAHTCSISLFDADRGEIVAESPHYGSQSDGIPRHRFRLADSRISKLILERGEPYLANHVSDDPLFEPATEAADLQSLLAVAMKRPAGPTGFIYLLNRPGGFNQLDADLLSAIGEQVAVALENAHSFDDAYKASITDPLTDLYNRRFFDARLRQEFQRVRRTGKTLGLMFVDLDRFKQVNDVFGHEAGNLVLTQVARIIRQNCRSADVAARWGGDEFTVLLTESEPASLEVIARRVRDGIQQTNWGPVGSITATIGLAVMPQDAQTLEGLMQAADEAMYLAKKRGRNTYALAREMRDETIPPTPAVAAS